MNINFKSIDIENFRSIEKAHIELLDQGVVIVKGINEYEDKASSNGSGKSSIFEAIIFALFEETSSGEKDVENRINNNGYSILLTFYIDNDKYQILRELKNKKSNTLFYKNDIDISAHTKTDTNKMILSTLKITKDIFLDSVFLSQGSNTNIASLSPSARKERLEILTNTDMNIDIYKNKIKQIQDKYNNLIFKNEEQFNLIKGQNVGLGNQLNSIESKLYEITQLEAKRDELGNIEDINKTIEDLENKIQLKENEIDNLEKEKLSLNDNKLKIDEEKDKINNEIMNLTVNQDDLRLNISQLNSQIQSLDNDDRRLDEIITSAEKEKDKLKNSDTCPTCGRKYDNLTDEWIDHLNTAIKEKDTLIDNANKSKDKNNADKQDLQLQIKAKEAIKDENEKLIQDRKNIIKDINDKSININNSLMQINNNITTLKNEITLLKSNIMQENNIKTSIINFKIPDKTEFENMKSNIKKDIDSNNIELQKIDKLREEYDMKSNIIKHCNLLITKEFRTYLLKNSIQFLNTLLEKYSKELFSNEKDVIMIKDSNSKLDIILGDSTYESLSGGEKTRVNIALLLAQKELANTIGNISYNIIILDEVLGYCDSEAEINVTNLIMQQLISLQTIFMISHKELPIGYDKEIVVIKDKKGLSRVKTE